MGRESGQNISTMMEDLVQNAPNYSVFYAIYICEKLLKKQRPDLHWDMLEQHSMEFRPYEHYIFSAKNIKDITINEEEVVQFVLSFLGLYGVDSPLPRCYHEQVAIQQSIFTKGEIPLQNFLDIFNNRFYWLYYQAWKKYRFYLHVNEDVENKVTQQISSFIGLGMQSRQEELPVPRYKLLQLSGILSHRIRSKEGLLILLREFFGDFSIQIDEFVKSMVKVEERPRIGRKYGKNSVRLGVHSLVGQWVADHMSRIRLIIGPLEFDDFLEFLPGGRSADLLRYLLTLYLNDSMEYDVKLLVKSSGIKPKPWGDERLQLGKSLWLGKPKKTIIEKYFKHEEYTRVHH